MNRTSRIILRLGAACLLALLAAAASLAQHCSDDLPFGFVALRSQSPLQQLRFGLLHHNSWVTPPDNLCLYLEHTWKNIWLYEPGYYRIDAEVHEFSVRTCYGLSSGVEISADVPIRYISGGILDPAIEGFHDLMSIGNAGRDGYPRNQFWFALNPSGEAGDWRTAGKGPIGWEIGNTVLSLTTELPHYSAGRFRASATLNVKFPTGSQSAFFGEQAVDLGISATVGRQFGPVWVFVSPGVVYYSDATVLGVDLHRNQFSGLAAVEYHPAGSRHSWVLQTLVETGIAKEYREFSDATYELLFGYKYRISENALLEFGFLENLFFFNNSPDFGLHWGLQRRLTL